MAETVLGRRIRQPYPGEDAYFRANRHVAGMAGEDGQVTLNPYSGLDADQQMAVARNEAVRLHQMDHGLSYAFPLTDKQKEFFDGTAYGSDPVAARQTVVARILAQDPSAMDATFDQRMAAMGTAIHLDHVLNRLRKQNVGR